VVARWRRLAASSLSGSRASSRGADIDHARLLEAVARSLRSGSSLTGAVHEALAELPTSPAALDLDRSMAAVRAGAPVVDALDAWTSGDNSRARRLAGTALTLGAELGGMPARSLDAAASGLRDRAEVAREVRALSAQARASAVVMVLAPPVFVALASAADTALVRVLISTPLGLTCLVAGLTLDLAGALWMGVLVRRVS
jgi:tight adherence protein B